jgi:hypothetical protein
MFPFVCGKSLIINFVYLGMLKNLPFRHLAPLKTKAGVGILIIYKLRVDLVTKMLIG